MMKLQELPNGRERVKFQSLLQYLQDATFAPNMMELTAIVKMKDPEVKRAIGFWKKAGLIREICGEFYHINQLN